MLDIFKNDAFGVVPLTDAINQLKFVPGRIAQMGLFRATSVSAITIAIEKKGSALILVPPTPRGAPGTTVGTERRNLRDLRIPHFEINDAVMAEQVQGVRTFGSESLLETVQDKIMERGGEHSQSFAATTEFSQIGAIKGVVTYADGSTLDLFDEFDVTQMDEVDFDLDNADPTDGVLRKKCAGIIRALGGELEGIPFSGVHAFCGDNFFDDLLQHSEVRDTYKGYSAAAILREGYVKNGASWGSFEFGGITFENYRGAVGATGFVDTDKCHIFPLGAPGLFRTYWAPADYNETVNTMGQRLYAKQYEMPNGKGVHFDVQMNELNICTRPRALIKGKRT